MYENTAEANAKIFVWDDKADFRTDWATALKKDKDLIMLYYQCEQTTKGAGCTIQGACDKMPENDLNSEKSV